MNNTKIQYYIREAKKWFKIMKKGRYNSEEDTMVKIILPFFEMLGWNRSSNDMEFEYRVFDKERNKSDHVDIALYICPYKKPKILVEIKRLVPDLSRGTQISRYLKNSKVRWGIFTNGRELKLITNMGRKDSGPNVVFYFKELDDFKKYSEVLSFFSKISLAKRKLDKFFNYYHDEYWEKYYKEHKKEYPKEERYKLCLEYAQNKLKVL